MPQAPERLLHDSVWTAPACRILFLFLAKPLLVMGVPTGDTWPASFLSSDMLHLNSTGCRIVLRKVLQLLEFDIRLRKERGLPCAFQSAALARFNDPKATITQVDMQHTQAALGLVGLGTALQMGAIWSVEDQSLWRTHCFGEDPSQLLEEHSLTYTGDRLFQGDIADPTCEEENQGPAGAAYRGCQTKTRSGLLCQRWDAQTPHSHTWSPAQYPEADLSQNFCRNPKGHRLGIWCFTTDKSKPWDYCDPRTEQDTVLQWSAVEREDFASANLLKNQIKALQQLDSSRRVQAATTQTEIPANRSKVTVHTLIRRTWANGNVQYCYGGSSSAAARDTFEAAVKHIRNQVKCLNFTLVKWKNSDECEVLPSIMVESLPGGCWSHVGQVSRSEQKFKTRSQKLNLGPGCELQGLVAHQLGHALGLGHEVNRYDRDVYVRISWGSVAGGISVDFQTNPAVPEQSLKPLPFDLLSIMMAGPHAFSMNSSTTIEPLREPLLGRYIGQRMSFSQLDVQKLGDIYSCPFQTSPITLSKALTESFLNGTGMVLDGSCRDSNYTGVEVVDGSSRTRTFSCQEAWRKCYDYRLGSRLRERCPLTCLLCTPAPPEVIGLAALTTTSVPKAARAELPPVQTCVDAAQTGIRFRTGPEATCEELVNYCDHATMGQKVKEVCGKTCGLCDLRSGLMPLPVGVAARESTPTDCRDQPVDAKPVFTIADRPTACLDLKAFCNGHPDSEQVLRKCPNSCGLCLGSMITTTRAYTFSTSMPESLDNETSCSRRRRWGFCATRRRRLS